MAATNRKRSDFQSGKITNDPLLIAGVTLNSAELNGFPIVADPDFYAVTLDPEEADGAPEVVWITVKATSAATSATILRAQEGTTARQHALNTKWGHGPTVKDWEITANEIQSGAVGDDELADTLWGEQHLKDVVGAEGIVASADLKVTIGAGTREASVAVGTVYIDQTSTTMRRHNKSSVTTLTASANGGAGTRTDLVVIAGAGGAITIVEGTPGGGVPATPAGKYALGRYDVAVSAAAISNVVDMRDYAGLFRRPRGVLGRGTIDATTGWSPGDVMAITVTPGVDRRVRQNLQSTVHDTGGPNDFSAGLQIDDVTKTAIPSRANSANTQISCNGEFTHTIADANAHTFEIEESEGGNLQWVVNGAIAAEHVITDEGGLNKPAGSVGQ